MKIMVTETKDAAVLLKDLVERYPDEAKAWAPDGDWDRINARQFAEEVHEQGGFDHWLNGAYVDSELVVLS